MRLIDADALKDDFCAMTFPTDRMNILELIDKQPTITAEQKHGAFAYCPHCGARLDGGSEDAGTD